METIRCFLIPNSKVVGRDNVTEPEQPYGEVLYLTMNVNLRLLWFCHEVYF